jgi:hypothetical protein
MLSETWEDQYRRMHWQYDLLKRTADQNKFEEIHEMPRARDISTTSAAMRSICVTGS